jgi:aspartyl-tRNA(Asn)/glutamyl-tRNA(Gln) amidotransferase subunit B
MISSGKSATNIIAKKGYKSVGDKDEIRKIVDKVIVENEKSISDYRSGKIEALGFLVGQVMRESHGSANPQIVNEIIKEKLS